jgi:hypothetical protein
VPASVRLSARSPKATPTVLCLRRSRFKRVEFNLLVPSLCPQDRCRCDQTFPITARQFDSHSTVELYTQHEPILKIR